MHVDAASHVETAEHAEAAARVEATGHGEAGAQSPTDGRVQAGGELCVRLPDPGGLGSVGEARGVIDEIDAALATLLEHRAAVAGRIQALKPVGGFAGRNPEREREIVAAMAERAPTLGPARLARIMTAVIEGGLEAAAEPC